MRQNIKADTINFKPTGSFLTKSFDKFENNFDSPVLHITCGLSIIVARAYNRSATNHHVNTTYRSRIMPATYNDIYNM